MLLDALDSLLARRTGGHFDYEILVLGETTELTNVPYRLSSRMLPGSGNVLISRAAADAGGFDVTLLSGELRYDLFARMRDAGFELWFSHPLASIMSSLLRELFPVANRSSLA
jgi:hypothetical protein